MAQVNKISSFKSFTEVKNQEATMKLRETNNAKRQETVGKIGSILDEMGLTSLSELDEEKKQALINKMFGNVSEDEAEDIEAEINKLGEPKKLEEGNAFGDAVRKAKDDGKEEFEFDGKTFKVEEALNTLNEGRVKAATLLQELIDGNTSRAEGIKMSKDLAEHYLYWLRTSPYGKKNTDLPLYMLIKSSFSWGIERGLDPKLKVELEALKAGRRFESVESIDEARTIAKIQYDWSKLTTTMQATAQNWKVAEGPAKEMLLGKLKEMTAQKNALETELDAAIADKDKDIELVISEAFYRLPKDVIGTELYVANQNLQSLYGRAQSGNDIDPKELDAIVKLLQQAKSLTKKFNNKEEVAGTVYEKEVNLFDEVGPELEALRSKISGLMKKSEDDKWTSALGKALTALSTLDRNLSQADSKLGVVLIKESVVNEGAEQNPLVKRSCIERLSQFFRVSPNALSHFKFDGTDNIKALSKALNSTSDEGTEAYYKVAIRVGKQDAGIEESVYEGKAKDLKPNHKYTSDYGEVTFIKLNPDGKTMKLHSKETGEIKTDISNAYNMELIESTVNEADMTKFYDGFKVLNDKTGEMTKFKYIKGTKNQNVENEAIAKLMKATGLTRANFGVHGFVKKGEWSMDKTPVLESLTEGMISPKMANGFKIGNKIKTQNGTYTITGFGQKTGATRDFEAENENGEQFNLRVSLRGATGIQVAAGARNLNFPEQQEMLESVVNEAEKFKSTQDFEEFCEEIDGMPEVRIKRIMGKDYIDTPGGYRDEAEDYDNDIIEYMISNMGRSDFEELKTWWENNVQESVVTEGAAKQFDVDFTMMVKNIKSGYGWIDPEYVADTWENSSTSIDFELVKGEIYKRLIAAGLLAYADDEDEEVAGKYVKSIKELGIKESVVNEAEVKSDDEFKEYAMTVLKKAFGDDFDEAKATEVVDGILKKCGDDYGAAVGMITSSLGESVTNEGIWPKSKLASSFQFKLADELKQNFKGVFYSIGNDLYHNDEKVYTVDGDKDSIDSIILKLKKIINESVVTEAFDANYWEDYQEGAEKMKNPSGMQIMQDVQAAVEDWNDNNEMGEENEVTPAGEKKVLKLAKEFVKAKGWISFDIIDAMIAQES